MTAAAPGLGGLVEFYRIPAREAWTPTGSNVPDYPKLAQLWWTRIDAAVRGRATPQQVLDDLAANQDLVMSKYSVPGAHFGYEKLINIGFAIYLAKPTTLVVTLRGPGMLKNGGMRRRDGERGAVRMAV